MAAPVGRGTRWEQGVVPATNESAHIDPRGLGAPTALRVLLVVAQATLRDELRAAVVRIAPGARIEATDSVLDAMLCLARQSVDLALVDLAVEAALVPALLRHLARVAPGTVVLVFDDFARGLPGYQKVWPWRDVDTALEHWLQRRGERGTDPR